MANTEKVSRRSLFATAGIAAGLVTVAQAPAQTQSVPAGCAGTPRVLALVGDRFHNADYIRVSLDRVFGELNIPIEYTMAYDKLSAALLRDYQALLILRDGQIFPKGYLGPDQWSGYSANLETPKTFPDPAPVMWMTEAQGAAIKEFVSAGNGLYAMHNSSHISLSSKNFRDVMGGAYIQHPPLRPFRVRATANRHPITDGISPFMVTDEQHYVAYDQDPRHIILEAENIDGLSLVCGAPKVCQVFPTATDPAGATSSSPEKNLGTKSIAGWAYDFGKGRVVFTAVGHDIHAMWTPQYLEVQKRAIRWLLKQI